MKVPISEIFFSLQMEGSFIGYPAIFIRFSGCNLSCDFCDTKYALSGGIMTEDYEIYERISDFNAQRIIFTGGEPALYDDFMLYFMKKYNTYKFFLETNGTIFIKKSIGRFYHIVVSPKFFAIDEDVLSQYKQKAKSVEFKFLINNEQDIKKAEALCKKLDLYPATLQPVFDNGQSVEKYIKKIKMLTEAFKHSELTDKNVRLIAQNHKIIYKEQRGV